MALSGSFTNYFQGNASRFHMTTSWSATQNIANNTSTITAITTVRPEGAIGSTASKNGSITIAGNRKNFTFVLGSIGAGVTKEVGRHTFTFSHASNGTGSAAISSTLDIIIQYSGKPLGSLSTSGTASLTTIPRASKVTLSHTSRNILEPLTIYTNRVSTSFTHYLYWRWSDTSSWNRLTTNTTDSFVFNLSQNQLPLNYASRTMVIGCDTYSGSTFIGTSSASFVLSIQKSEISISDPKRPMGGTAVRIYTNSISDNLTYAVSYYSRAGVWTAIATKSRFAYVDFVIPLDFAYAIPNGVETPVKLVLETYNGTQSLGYSYINVIGQIPADIKPTFSAITASENVSSVASLVGAFVQTKSRLNLAITGASGIYGSTIRSYNITGVGHNVNSSSTVTGYLSVSGNQTITGTVTDSRGRTFSKSIVVNILPYTPPSLTGVSFKRTLPDKTEAPLGDNATVIASVKVHSLIVNGVQKNSIKYQVQSAQSGGYSFADKVNTTYAGLVAGYSTVWSGYSVDYSYNFRVRAADVFGWGGWIVGVVPTGIVTQQWSRKTTSFGKMIDNNSYNVQVGAGGMQNDGPYVGGQRRATIFDKSTDDLNNAIDEWVVSGPTTQNGTGVYSYVQTIMYSNPNQRRQMAWGYNNDSHHTRWLFGGSWSPWRKVW